MPVFQEARPMTVAPSPDQVRLLVARSFREFGSPVQNELDLHETLVVERGELVARSYRADGIMAMWLIRSGLIQFYGRDGNMLGTINLLLEDARPELAAA
jgi:hypothetical protein